MGVRELSLESLEVLDIGKCVCVCVCVCVRERERERERERRALHLFLNISAQKAAASCPREGACSPVPLLNIMASEKGHKRSSSLGKYSFFSCFTGVIEDTPKPAPFYEKLSTQQEAMPGQQKPPPTIQLGGRAAAKSTKRCLSFSSVALKDSKGGLGSKVKEACEQALEVAKKSSPHITELFVGGQLFMHVTPAHLGHKPSKQQSFSPSIGFLHMAAPTMDGSLHER